MKKSIKVLGLLLIMMLFTGCMKSSTDIVVNKDGSVDISYTAAISTKVSDMMKNQEGSDEDDSLNSGTISEEQRQAALDNGYEISEYNEDGYQGAKVTKHINSIDEISDESDIESKTTFAFEDNQKMFTVKKGFFTNTYKAKISYSSEKESSSQMSEYINDEDYKEYFEGLDLSVNITLPSKAKSNNATSVDNNKYTWDLTKFDGEAIEVEFDVINWKNVIIVCACTLVVICAVVTTIIVIKKKRS